MMFGFLAPVYAGPGISRYAWIPNFNLNIDGDKQHRLNVRHGCNYPIDLIITPYAKPHYRYNWKTGQPEKYKINA